MKRTKTFFSSIMAIAVVTWMASATYAGVAANLMRTSDDQLVIAEGVCNNAETYVAYPTEVLKWTFDADGTCFSQNHPAIAAAGSEHIHDALYDSSFQYLPGNMDVYFAFRAFNLAGSTTNLAYWDGNGAVNFTAVSDGTTLSIRDTNGSTTADGSSSDVAGYAICTTESDGYIHAHPNHYIEKGGVTPEEGIYLWCMELSMPDTNLTATEPFFVVINTPNCSISALDAAATWVADNAGSLSPVPEPSTWILFGSAGLGIFWWRRRNRVPTNVA